MAGNRLAKPRICAVSQGENSMFGHPIRRFRLAKQFLPNHRKGRWKSEMNKLNENFKISLLNRTHAGCGRSNRSVFDGLKSSRPVD